MAFFERAAANVQIQGVQAKWLGWGWEQVTPPFAAVPQLLSADIAPKCAVEHGACAVVHTAPECTHCSSVQRHVHDLLARADCVHLPRGRVACIALILPAHWPGLLSVVQCDMLRRILQYRKWC
jgi:hypothetical protein